MALIHVFSPDEHGFCSLGVSVDIAPSVLENAKLVIAQVNLQMPRTFGDALIHSNPIDVMVDMDEPVLEIEIAKPDALNTRIAEHVASLIENGSTLQLGIGRIPNAVLKSLEGHRQLGIHTEMFSDGIVDLIERGVITGEMKKKRKLEIVSSFMIGSKKLYEFVDNNPSIEMLDIAYVNDVHIIRQNPKVAAINCALEIDLTGQVCADSIGSKMYSGVGGQMDFMRGASLSEGGKPIITMPSVTASGESKIVPFLKIGAGVVITRANVHYIVTEYGIAYLYRTRMLGLSVSVVLICLSSVLFIFSWRLSYFIVRSFNLARPWLIFSFFICRPSLPQTASCLSSSSSSCKYVSALSFINCWYLSIFFRL